MSDCSIIDVGLNGEARDAAGIPTRLGAYARIDGQCNAVRLSVSQSQGGTVLFTGIASPDSNGTVSIGFPVEPPVFPCNFSLSVLAECVNDASCSKEETVVIQCKGYTPGGGNGGGNSDDSDNNGGSNSNNGDNENSNWPWPSPPELFCPLIGRSFTTALLAGLITLITSIALNVPAGIAAGTAIIAGAFAIFSIWRTWCTPNTCYVLGAILWALKRSVLGGLVIGIFTLSFGALLTVVALGAIAGGITGMLRYDRCQIPAATTPIGQLPLW